MNLWKTATLMSASLALWACSEAADTPGVVLSDEERQAAATAFLDDEIGDKSTLTREEQEAELAWFMEAA